MKKFCFRNGIFRNFGCRSTVPRQLILEILQKNNQHISADEIFLQLRNIYHNIGLTTVYRTLELLVRMGVVEKFEFGDGKTRYEIVNQSNTSKHHHHLVCTNCGLIIDYNDFASEEQRLINQTEKVLVEKYSFKIKGHQIQFFGLCNKCNK